MLDKKLTRIYNRSIHRPVETGAIFEDEGIAAVYAKENGITVVRPSTGANGEVFAGFSLSRNTPPTFNNIFVEGIVPESGVLELARIPVNGQFLIRNNAGAALTVTAEAPAAATEAWLDGQKVTVDDSLKGKAYSLQYRYEMSVAEAKLVVGDAPMGGLSSSDQGIIGLLIEADVATSYFDASVDWTNAVTVRLGAGGVLTTKGSGTVIPGVVVLQAPSAGSPFLLVGAGHQ